MTDDIDKLIAAAGRTHVIPPREDPALLNQLRDPRVLIRARQLLASKDRAAREQAVLCIERIGYVSRDQETAEVLLGHASTAKNKYEVMTALEALKNCNPPHPLPAAPLLRLAQRREWQVWLSAIQCLHLANSADVEPTLLGRLDTDDVSLLVFVVRELRYVRSERSIRALEQLLSHRNLDVRCVALDSLGERLGPDVVPLARQFATGRQQADKWWAEKWLARYGGVEDVPFMAKRVKRLLSGTRQRQYEPPEVSYLVPFLLRFEDIDEAQAALRAVARRAEKLPQNERSWLEAHAPDVLRGQ